LFRNNPKLVAEFNCKYEKVAGENVWFPKNTGGSYTQFENQFIGKKAYVIGKGPSLDTLVRIEDENCLIFALNQAIHVVEKLQQNWNGLLFCVQQDATLQDKCIPKNAIHLLSESAKGWNPNAVLFNMSNFGVRENCITAVATIKLAKYMGVKDFTFLAFDACKTKNTSYAKTIGGKPPKPEQFLKHKAWMEKELKDCKYSFV
jgi:hypothetical protein